MHQFPTFLIFGSKWTAYSEIRRGKTYMPSFPNAFYKKWAQCMSLSLTTLRCGSNDNQLDKKREKRGERGRETGTDRHRETNREID